MTEQVQQEEVSDYDAEWELDTDAPTDQDVAAEDDQQTFEEDTASSDEATDGAEEATSDESTDSPAEGDEVDDVWASATEEQRLAHQRAMNESKAAAQRAKIAQDRLAERGREMKALRDANRELQETSRQPTEFEQEHETYAENINEMIERRLTAAGVPLSPEEEEAAPEEVELEAYDVITSAHPDAGEVYNSPEMQAMIADDPVFKIDGKAYLFSEALHSPDANTAVKALDHYKSTLSSTDGAGLDDMVAPSRTSSQRDMRSTSSLSAGEQYDAEWENED